jgi:hypothetical protein
MDFAKLDRKIAEAEAANHAAGGELARLKAELARRQHDLANRAMVLQAWEKRARIGENR